MRNVGAERARTDALAFIDDDCLPPPDWLERMRPIVGSPAVGMAGCRVVSARRSFWNRCADYALFNCYQGYRAVDLPLGSAALVVRVEAFRQAGGFDESLLASEDWDFSLKMQRAGWRCRFIPEVEVLHDHGRGRFREILRQAFRSGRQSGLTVLRRHYGHVSPAGRLGVILASPALYWMLILPYALLTATLQALPALRRDPLVIAFWPIVILSRMAYHAGVWKAQCARPAARQEIRPS
jgi:GT2 family glycosyltransferase